MARPSEDDREAVNRAFAELVSGYHLTADRPEPAKPAPSADPTPRAEAGGLPPADNPAGPDPTWADQHPLFRFDAPPRELRADPVRRDDESYGPEPLPPLSRPGAPALLGWIGVGFACLVVLATAFGLHLPPWMGWLAVGSFMSGFAVLLSRLPRDRPPDAGDGAVL
jgi:hypothetical protein